MLLYIVCGFLSRSPRGERGLKFQRVQHGFRAGGSLPAWGAWIEIYTGILDIVGGMVAPRVGSVD